MKKIHVKICGIRGIESAEAAVYAGADFIGINFIPTSKRYITQHEAQKIIDQIRNRIAVVGIFQNASFEDINALVKKLSLDIVQLHGDEDEYFIRKIKANVIKSFRISQMAKIDAYIGNDSTRYLLLDREEQGSGKMVNVKKAVPITKQIEVFLAGGITTENVSNIGKNIRPFAFDIASGIETGGKEDVTKIYSFVKKVNGLNIVA